MGDGYPGYESVDLDGTNQTGYFTGGLYGSTPSPSVQTKGQGLGRTG